MIITGKTHIAGGIFAGALIAQYLHLGVVETAGIMSMTAAAALIPDIDTESSKIGAVTRPVSTIISRIFGHRKLFHAPLVYALLALALRESLPVTLYLGLVGGVLSHLLLDGMTRRGIPWLYPFHHSNISISLFRANGVLDWLMLYALTLGATYITLTRMQ